MRLGFSTAAVALVSQERQKGGLPRGADNAARARRFEDVLHANDMAGPFSCQDEGVGTPNDGVERKIIANVDLCRQTVERADRLDGPGGRRYGYANRIASGRDCRVDVETVQNCRVTLLGLGAAPAVHSIEMLARKMRQPLEKGRTVVPAFKERGRGAKAAKEVRTLAHEVKIFCLL
ncbi:hypothetical protein AURANDRAFT_67340 [Aureococcus anophagefferens]|uniref:Uncharacterized protein n=1 Tax=Aureococcus anophagefferens TaxID=44056 RepID=F0YKT9_AURAN|nr:hypothetical protein AURANDRAFT_67340 [Aureococcus anophagefferens]EGB04308.1 hypothetical protein AURANDRAFT_67340 [Aureococcus anophagefferens]|eukprot:XP_009041018.1 hypothetical protein AURANDRAFT_67340 [Aureococcus anophagefferens]